MSAANRERERGERERERESVEGGSERESAAAGSERESAERGGDEGTRGREECAARHGCASAGMPCAHIFSRW